MAALTQTSYFSTKESGMYKSPHQKHTCFHHTIEKNLVELPNIEPAMLSRRMAKL
jgi:hypothetical protein